MSPAEFKEIRERLGMTQAEMAELLGLSGRTPTAHYEMGFRKPSNLIAAIVRILDDWPEKKSSELREELKNQIAKLTKKKRKGS